MGEMPTIFTVLGDMLPILGISLLFFTLVAGLAGTVYGFLAARGPVNWLWYRSATGWRATCMTVQNSKLLPRPPR